MTQLHLDQAEEPKPSLRSEVTRRMLLSASTVGGPAIVWGVFELLRQQPQEGFKLLETWGPKFLLWLVLMYFIWDLMRQGLHWFGRGVRAFEEASSSMRSIENVAGSIKALADKDDVQRREDQLLLDHLNNQVKRIGDGQLQFEERMLDKVKLIDQHITDEFRTMRKLQEG